LIQWGKDAAKNCPVAANAGKKKKRGDVARNAPRLPAGRDDMCARARTPLLGRVKERIGKNGNRLVGL